MQLDDNKVQTMDVNMLLSILNLKLRNDFNTLTLLCSFYELNETHLIERMAENGFAYQPERNQFK